jgi:TonB family protein
MRLSPVALAFALALAAQPTPGSKKPAAPVPTFSLGATREAVMARLGAPRYYIDGRSGTVISTSRYPRISGIYPLAAPVYFRKTLTNEYELRLSFELDDSQSRLHPTERLSGVHIRIDRPRPFIEIASDILEATVLCRQSCSAKATNWIWDSIILIPGTGENVATFKLTDDLSPRTAGNPDRAWLSRQVLEIEFEAHSAMPLPPEDRGSSSTTKVLNLGSWQPGSEFKFAALPPQTVPPRAPEDRPYLSRQPVESALPSEQAVSGTGGSVFRVGSGVSAPQLVYRVEPEYTEAARKAKYQGTVVLYAVIDEVGKVRDLKVARALGLGLDEKAINAVRQWKFRPGLKDGKPVSVSVQIEVTFRDVP